MSDYAELAHRVQRLIAGDYMCFFILGPPRSGKSSIVMEELRLASAPFTRYSWPLTASRFHAALFSASEKREIMWWDGFNKDRRDIIEACAMACDWSRDHNVIYQRRHQSVPSQFHFRGKLILTGNYKQDELRDTLAGAFMQKVMAISLPWGEPTE